MSAAATDLKSDIITMKSGADPDHPFFTTELDMSKSVEQELQEVGKESLF